MSRITRGALALGLLAAGAAAQVQIRERQQPPTRVPATLIPVAEAKKQIAAARTVQGKPLPTGERLRRVVARLDGEPILLDELLDEVVTRFGAPLVPGVASQELMKMEALRRGIEVTEEDFLQAVRYRLAQNRSPRPLAEQLAAGGTGWERFADSIRTQAALYKMVKADQHITTPGPPNQFMVQIWAGTMRGRYTLDVKPESLPPGVYARVEAAWPAPEFVAILKRARAAKKPYGIGVGVAPGEETEKLEFTPPGGGWPRFYLPLTLDRWSGELHGALAAEAAVEAALAGPGRWATRLRIVSTGDGAPRYFAPLAEVEKTGKEGEKPTKVPLAEVMKAVGEQGFAVDADRGEVRPASGWPRYALPAADVDVRRPGGPTLPLAEVLAALAGRKGVHVSRVEVLQREGDVCVWPAVEVKTFVDRPMLVGLLFGSLKLAHFDEALEELGRFKAVKKAFAGHLPGQPRGQKPNAPWGVITVDEPAVAARIARERARYAGTMFPWETICQLLGKTIPGEIRRFWIGNGVDQIIGAEVDEKTLKAYYEAHVDNFAAATVEASHILFQHKDARTGRIDWPAARRDAERVLAMIRTGADFAAMASKYSDDPATREKGGDLGLFTLVSRYNRDLCRAAFALEAGEISAAPVRTRLGYHLLKVRKKAPPDPARYGWDSPGRKAEVRDFRQAERQRAWLEEHVYGRYRLESFLDAALK